MTQGDQNDLRKRGPVLRKRAARAFAAKWRVALAVLVMSLGLVVAVVGIAEWSHALALVVLGVSLIVYALVFIDLDSPTRRGR